MRKLEDQEKLEAIFVVLSDLRYHLHKEENTFSDYRRIAEDYYSRIAETAQFAAEMLPSDVVEKYEEL